MLRKKCVGNFLSKFSYTSLLPITFISRASLWYVIYGHVYCHCTVWNLFLCLIRIAKILYNHICASLNFWGEIFKAIVQDYQEYICKLGVSLSLSYFFLSLIYLAIWDFLEISCCQRMKWKLLMPLILFIFPHLWIITRKHCWMLNVFNCSISTYQVYVYNVYYAILNWRISFWTRASTIPILKCSINMKRGVHKSRRSS